LGILAASRQNLQLASLQFLGHYILPKVRMIGRLVHDKAIPFVLHEIIPL